MMDEGFNLKCGILNSVVVEKGNISFSIEKGSDGDIWFHALNDTKLLISYSSRNCIEWQCFAVFEQLMKSIFGKFVLDGEFNLEYNRLPKDFIDIENKTITLHLDSNLNDYLQFTYVDDGIVVSIFRIKNDRTKNVDNSIRVRIRTNGSEYRQYYKEFEKFFVELLKLATQYKTDSEVINKKNNTICQKLSLFRK